VGGGGCQEAHHLLRFYGIVRSGLWGRTVPSLVRTGRIGLRHCLHKLGVPDYESSQCSCSAGAETLRHVLLECPYEAERRLDLRKAQGGQLDYNRLLCSPKGARIASKWMIQSGRIPQFQLAGSLLYTGEGGTNKGQEARSRSYARKRS
jgi:hypothetical protein